MASRFLMTFALVCATGTALAAFAEEASDDPKPETPAALPVPEQSETPAPAASTPQVPAPKPAPVPPAKPVIESGLASVYSSDLEGRLTASGAPYDSQQLTAAHRTLPLGSRIRVSDPASGRSVSVTVNDRWGGGPGQIVNLSRRAADELGMRGSGQRKVDLAVETLAEGRPPPAQGYTTAAPQLLPARIEPTSKDSAARARSCENEASILGLQDTLRAIHVRNCLGRKTSDSAAAGQVKAKQ